jgi:hypothetical protein
MSTRLTRALVLSFGIAVFFTAVCYWLLNETDFKKKALQVKKHYNVSYRIRVGATGDAARGKDLTVAAIKDRCARMSWKFELEPHEGNDFLLTIREVEDTGSVGQLLTGSGRLELLDMYTMKELFGAVQHVDSLLSQEFKDNLLILWQSKAVSWRLTPCLE